MPFPGRDALIIDGSAIKPKLWFDGLVSLVGFADLGDGPDCKLCGESKIFSNRIVNGLVYFNLVGTVQSENSLSNVVTSLVKPLHCFTERLLCCSGEGSSLTIKVRGIVLKISFRGFISSGSGEGRKTPAFRAGRKSHLSYAPFLPGLTAGSTGLRWSDESFVHYFMLFVNFAVWFCLPGSGETRINLPQRSQRN